MCGIAGIYQRQRQPMALQTLKRMTQLMSYRGPNDEGHVFIDAATGRFYEVERGQPPPGDPCYTLGLGNRRLSIIDLSAASHQPMRNAAGTLWLTYNGEIYNYQELAADLRRLGYQFSSGSDTEVILHAYEAYGVECVKRFNGMWAFALWDSRQQVLFCSRDRFGEKPFYYFDDGQTVVFASEIKALLLHPAVKKAPNYPTVFRYVARGYGFADLSDETFFEGIRQLPAAHSMVVTRSGIRIWRYWALEPTPGDARRVEDPVRQFRELFADSVRLRLRSDVPVGFCLSGGLDSSSIVCVASALNGGVTTFSSCSEDQRFDERLYIEPVVKQTGARAHFIFPEGKRLFEVLPKIMWHQDEPWSNLNIFAHWHLMACAREHGVPVLLNGHGGDETLAGYYPHFTSFHADLFKRLRFRRLLDELAAYRRIHEAPLWQELVAISRALGSHYFGGMKQALGWPKTRYAHLDVDFVRQHDQRRLSPRAGPSVLRNQLQMGLEQSPIPAWLRYEDRNSMAFSVETRQPFLDHRLVEFLFSIPDDLKIHQGMNKAVLRRALHDLLPEAVCTRSRKVGFTTPAAVWFRDDVQGPIRELLTSRRFKERRIFNVELILRQFEEHCRGGADRTFAIWSWVNLELWFQQFFG